MTGLNKNRKFKMLMSFIMSIVMIITLFAGIGAIWVTEDTDKAMAVDNLLLPDGKTYAEIPGNAGTVYDAEKGTNDNPFLVVEIVPQEDMAEFGYLVGGQEPVDLEKIDIADRKNGNNDNAEKLKYWVDRTGKAKDPSITEFKKLIPTEGPVYTKDGADYYESDFIPESLGEYNQYGYYKKQDGGNYKLHDDIVNIETIGEGYGYYIEGSRGEEGVSLSSLSDTDLASLDKSIFEGTEGVDYFVASNGDIYVKVKEGEGVYSDAVYKRNSLTVSFEMVLAGVDQIEEQQIVYGQHASEPSEPSSALAEFKGWKKRISDTEIAADFFDFAGTEITENTVLVAQWDCTVTFNANGGKIKGESTWTDIVSYDTAVLNPGNATWRGHTFSGWKESGESESYDFSRHVTRSIELVAQWNLNNHKVVFNAGEGHFESGNDDKTVIIYKDYGDSVSAPSNDPARTGFEFKGWRLKGTSSNATFPYTVEDEDLEFTAQWEELKLTVTFLGGEGGTIEGSTSKTINNIRYGTTIDAPIPEREGYTQNGWKDNNNNSVTFPKSITEDLTVTAQWTINSYSIIFDAGEGGFGEGGSAPKTKSLTKEYHQNITQQDVNNIGEPNRPDYKFDGWELVLADNTTTAATFPYQVGAGNVTFRAKWKRNVWTVRFYDKGVKVGEIEVDDQAYLADTDYPGGIKQGDGIVKTENGYEFFYWAEAGSTVEFDGKITKNTDLKAVYKKYYYVTENNFNNITNTGNYFWPTYRTNFTKNEWYVEFERVTTADQLANYTVYQGTVYNTELYYTNSDTSYTRKYQRSIRTNTIFGNSMRYYYIGNANYYAIFSKSTNVTNNGMRYMVKSGSERKASEYDATKNTDTYNWMTYNREYEEPTYWETSDASSMFINAKADMSSNDAKVVSFASRATTYKETKAKVFASEGEPQTPAFLDNCEKIRDIEVVNNTDKMPEYIDETSGLYVGNKNYVRLFLKKSR